jgi:sugar phosphate isomerase/epimerase
MRTEVLELEPSKFSMHAQWGNRDRAYGLCESLGLGIELVSLAVPPALNDEQEFSRQSRAYHKELARLPVFKSMHGPFMEIAPHSLDSSIATASALRVGRAMKAAREIGCSAVIFHTGINTLIQAPGYIEQAISRQVTFWSDILDRYPETTVLLENMWERSPSVLSGIAESIGDDRFGVCVDCGHAHIHGARGPAEWITELAPYLRHMHWNDNHGDIDSHLPLGAGNLDWPSVVRATNALRRKPQVVLEVGSIDAAETCIRFLRAVCSVQFPDR